MATSSTIVDISSDITSIGGGILSPLSLQYRQHSPNSSFNPLLTNKDSIPVTLWNSTQITNWLHEQGLPQYEGILKEQCINTGSVLLQLTEDHLKEMGICCIGHRLILVNGIDILRHKASLLPSAKFVNVRYLLEELEQACVKCCLECYPKRIILIRYGESQGNTDSSLYSHVPDAKLELTTHGIQQAQEAGLKLKEIIGEETCGFYVSPFIRSCQTFKHILQSFKDDQVINERKDPCIREQE